MQLIDAFVRNPVKVAVGVLLVSLFGVISVLEMPMQLTPEVQTPTLTIETRWRGASPQEVEREIVLEQEEQLKSVEGVTKMSSESMDSTGRITLEFQVGTDMQEALLKVNSRLQQVPEYPEDADEPVISTSSAADRPIAWFILSPRQPDKAEFDKVAAAHPELKGELEVVQKTQNPGLAMFRLRRLVREHPEAKSLTPADVDVTKMRRFAEDVIEARLERVPGVSNANVIGGLEDELQVIVDPEKLAARQLTVTDVRNRLRAQNVDVSGGDFWEGKRRWVVRTLGQFDVEEQVSAQLLAVRDGKPVFVRDVAEVKHDYKKPDGLVWRFGEQTIAVNALRETGSNVLDVTAGLRGAMQALNANELKQQGLSLAQVYDETEYIHSAVGLVQENIILGSALTMIVLMLFLNLDVRTLVAIPFILGTALAAIYISPWLYVLCLALILGVGLWYARGSLVVGLSIPIAIVGTFLVAASVGTSFLLWPKAEYLPTGNRNLVITIVLPPPGYNLDELTRLGETIAAELQPYWDIDPNSPEAHKPGHPAIGDFFFVARGRQVFLGLRAEDPGRVAELVPLIRQVGAKIPGTFVVAKQTSLFEQGLTAGRTIDIEITGPELKKLVEMGGGILGQVSGGQGRPGVVPGAQARPVPSLDLSSPEVHVEPKLLQAADLGLTTADIGYAIDALVDGAYASDYYIGGTKIDLTIKSRAATVERTQDLEALPIATPTGHLVPLGAVANVTLASGPEQVNHRERQRAITIEVTPPPEMALEDAMAKIEGQIVRPMREGGQVPPGYVITLSGTSDKLRSTWRALRFNVILALAITYLLMAALYESWLYPFVIIFSVPLGAVGGVMGLALLNLFVLQPLDVVTMLGFVILIGTVVNNAILIVDQALQHIRFDGMSPREAVTTAVRSRIRPIFMTTITTVLGLLPLVVFPGAGSELYRGLGSVVLGGLLVATFFTLFLIPCAFTLTLDARNALLGWFRPRKPAGEVAAEVVPQETIGV